MIKCHLSKILGERKKHMRELARETGLSYYTVWALYHEKISRIEFKTIEAICKALGVQVGDLFEYIPEEKKETKQRR